MAVAGEQNNNCTLTNMMETTGKMHPPTSIFGLNQNPWAKKKKKKARRSEPYLATRAARPGMSDYFSAICALIRSPIVPGEADSTSCSLSDFTASCSSS